jgi:alpha-mannosidase
MVHRATAADDSRGVGEALAESMCGCRAVVGKGQPNLNCLCGGLVARGSHYLVLGGVDEARTSRRAVAEQLNNAPLAVFGRQLGGLAPNGARGSFLSAALPKNVKLMTLKNMPAEDGHSGAMLLRLAHLYEVGESAALSAPATVSLAALFGQAALKIVAAEEWTLTANQPLAQLEARRAKLAPWRLAPSQGAAAEEQAAASQRVPFDGANPGMEVTIRPMEVRTFVVRFARRAGV